MLRRMLLLLGLALVLCSTGVLAASPAPPPPAPAPRGVQLNVPLVFAPPTLVLCGQPELRQRLRLQCFEAISQRINVRFHLAGLSNLETKAYIQHQIRVAGVQHSLFSDEVVRHIHQAAKGIPRRIYLFIFSAGQLAVYALITFADDVIYPWYAAAPRISWISAKQDQIYAGIIMNMGMMLVAAIALTLLFSRWARREEAASPQVPPGM